MSVPKIPVIGSLVKGAIINPIGKLTGIDPIGDLLDPNDNKIKPPKPAPLPPPPPPPPGAAPFVAPAKNSVGPVIGGQSDKEKASAKGRSSLVIDLNLGSTRGGAGLQIPR